MSETCEECGFRWDTPILEELRMIGELPERAQEIADGADEAVYKRSESNMWSPNEYVWHLSDWFHMFTEWMHLIRTQDDGVHIPTNPDAVADARRYGERTVYVAIWSLGNSCRLFVQEAAMTDPERTCMYKDWRPVTAAEVIGFAAHEAVHHLYDLERALPPSA